MSEYISRKAALNLIDRYWQQAYNAHFLDAAVRLGSVYREMEDIPAANVRPVARAMYDELIKALRVCVDEGKDCLDCPYYSKCMSNDSEEHKAMVDAADAIEELSRENKEIAFRANQLEAMNDALIGETGAADALMVASKPRWIPVSERLPDVFKHVLVNIPGMSPHPTVQEAFREKDGMWYSNGFRYGADEITHWMPLPEPPKEVLTGTDMRGGIRRDDAGNVIDWGITGPPGDVGKTEDGE